MKGVKEKNVQIFHLNILVLFVSPAQPKRSLIRSAQYVILALSRSFLHCLANKFHCIFKPPKFKHFRHKKSWHMPTFK